MKSTQIFPSRWLKPADLESDSEHFTVKKVVMEEVGEKRESKPVMTFKETDKALILNFTNWNSIAELTGKDDSDDWPGHKIKLVRVKLQIRKEIVDAIRIEAPDDEIVEGEVPF
jgi:hypothetical protein